MLTVQSACPPGHNFALTTIPNKLTKLSQKEHPFHVFNYMYKRLCIHLNLKRIFPFHGPMTWIPYHAVIKKIIMNNYFYVIFIS